MKPRTDTAATALLVLVHVSAALCYLALNPLVMIVKGSALWR